jgi:hypothetical protein
MEKAKEANGKMELVITHVASHGARCAALYNESTQS